MAQCSRLLVLLDRTVLMTMRRQNGFIRDSSCRQGIDALGRGNNLNSHEMNFVRAGGNQDDNLSTEKDAAELFVNPDETCAVNEGEIAGLFTDGSLNNANVDDQLIIDDIGAPRTALPILMQCKQSAIFYAIA